MNPQFIRNFAIIAHIDHGKSTLADRFLEITQSVSDHQKQDRLLDNMDIEKERGITIKAQAARLKYQSNAGQEYHFNLIDTPGHVDFSYEVSRSLASCDGALLVVDASQGIQAQTLANVYMAMEHDLAVIPVLNKIDLPHANTDRVKNEIEQIIGIKTDKACEVSAKTGKGVRPLLEAIVQQIPPPKGSAENPLQALIFDSWFDSYQGVVILVRVFEGMAARGDTIYLKYSERKYDVLKIAVNTPFFTEVDTLKAGEVGMLICGIKTIRDVKIGDTLVHFHQKQTANLPGYREVRPMVFCGIFPVESGHYKDLKESLEKLTLNDSSFSYEPENSKALGQGFRCGLLGPLHMNIVQERLEREFGLEFDFNGPLPVATGFL